jgi:TRAP-type mannitol/chloroaromatic compound transport system permease small subunit
MNHTPTPASPNPLVRWLDHIAEFTGNTTAWLTGIMVIIACIVVGLRHLFGIGSIALQESVTYMHAAVFMLGAAYTLKNDGHVRVDILHKKMSPQGRAWVEVLGSLLFTLPLMIFIGWGSLEFVQESWRVQEGSTDSGGMGGVYLLKSLLPLMALSVSLQAIAELLRSLLVLMNITPENAISAQEDSSC